MANLLRLKRSGSLERGDLRLLVLSMLKEPMHGYQIMCQFREHSHGDYKPSTGALYPQLRGLEEEGFIKIEEVHGKKTYAITKSGEEYLKRNEKLVKQTAKRFKEFWGENDMNALVSRMESIAKTLMEGSSKALETGDQKDSKKIERSKEILAKTEEELKKVWA